MPLDDRFALPHDARHSGQLRRQPTAARLFTRTAVPWASMPVRFGHDAELADTAPLERAYAAGGIRPDAS